MNYIYEKWFENELGEDLTGYVGASKVEPTVVPKASLSIKAVSRRLRNIESNIGGQNFGIVFFSGYAIKVVAKSKDKIIVTEEQEAEAYRKALAMNTVLKDLVVKRYTWPDTGLIFKVLRVEDYYYKCYIMSKLDGDLSSYILRNACDTFEEYELLKYNIMLWSKNEELKLSKKELEVKIDKISPKVRLLLQTLEKKIIDLHFKVESKGWTYIDLKLDNIGYKMRDGQLSLQFIDHESGLNKMFVWRWKDWSNGIEHNWTRRSIVRYAFFGSLNMLNLGFTVKDELDLKADEKNFGYYDHKERLEAKGFRIIDENESSRWIRFGYKYKTDRDYYYSDFCVLQRLIGGYYRILKYKAKQKLPYSMKLYDNAVQAFNDIVYDKSEPTGADEQDEPLTEYEIERRKKEFKKWSYERNSGKGYVA